VNVKDVQSALRGEITLGKGKQKWENACIENGMSLQELKTHVKIIFASKIIMFEETLEFKQAIITCYGR